MQNESLETNASESTNLHTKERSATLDLNVATLNEFYGITGTVHTLSTSQKPRTVHLTDNSYT